MKAAFDVLTQGWIPVSEQSGRLRKVGIEEVLKKRTAFQRYLTLPLWWSTACTDF